ncbi:MAG: hypothetical protein ACJ749_19495 [Flavisolibacter sp.]
MRAKTILLSLCLVASHFCFSQEALEFNDKLASINDSLFAKGQAWGRKFNEVSQTKEYSKLSASRIDLANFINTKIAELKKTADVSGSKEFREGMISFLVYEQGLLEKAFKPLEKLSTSSTDAEVKAGLDNLKKLAQDETAYLEAFRKVQVAYAEKNGFKIADQ